MGDGGWRNVSKALNIPVMVNKIFIIIGIGCGRSKDKTTKHIMIGWVFRALMMSLMEETGWIAMGGGGDIMNVGDGEAFC